VSAFIDRIRSGVVVCDGAMGTMLHTAGIALDRSLPELNVTNPDLVRAVHQAYVLAGADVIQTNTFGASRIRLSQYGLEDDIVDLNRAGVRAAKEVAGKAGRQVLVAGSVGPVESSFLRGRRSRQERHRALLEQLDSLLSEGVDLLILETFGDPKELQESVHAARFSSSVPIVAQLTFMEDGHTITGESPEDVADLFNALGADVVGVNCTLGPHGVLGVLRQLAARTRLPLSAQPNAGQPKMVGARRFRYGVDPAYFAKHALAFVESGASLVGGCCGTTPQHIAAVSRAIAGMNPPERSFSVETLQPVREVPRLVSAHAEAGSRLSARLSSGEFLTILEIESPTGADPGPALERAQALSELGVDILSIAPSASARAQFNPVSLGLLIKQRCDVETIVTFNTWDRSIMTLQADLLGAHACGIRSVLCRTGRPPLQGDYPNVDGIWAVDSLGLISLLSGLNAGRDCHGTTLTSATSFCIGARVNLGAADLAQEVRRARDKVRTGAAFIVTDPVYDLAALELFLAQLRAGDHVPVIVGINQISSLAQLEYLTNEVPEVSIPAKIFDLMPAVNPERQLEAGIAIAKQLIAGARELADGLLISATSQPEVVPRLLEGARAGGRVRSAG
jgi:homocysteine S-methyltransferase